LSMSNPVDENKPLDDIDYKSIDAMQSDDLEIRDGVPEKLRGIWVVTISNFISHADFTLSVDLFSRTITRASTSFTNDQLFSYDRIVAAFDNEDECREFARKLANFREAAQKKLDAAR